jgi:hypothetical protein
VKSLTWIARIVFRTDQYTKFLAHQKTSTKEILQQLNEDLVQLFAEVLYFLFQAKAFFEKPSWRK